MNLPFGILASCLWIPFAPPTIWFPSPAPVPREGHGTQGTFIKFYTGSSSCIQTRKVIISHSFHHSPGWRNGKLRPSKSCLYHHSDSLPTAIYNANDLNYILRTLNWYTFSRQSSCVMHWPLIDLKPVYPLLRSTYLTSEDPSSSFYSLTTVSQVLLFLFNFMLQPILNIFKLPSLSSIACKIFIWPCTNASGCAVPWRPFLMLLRDRFVPAWRKRVHVPSCAFPGLAN